MAEFQKIDSTYTLSGSVEYTKPVNDGAITYYGDAAEIVSSSKKGSDKGSSSGNIIIGQKLEWDIAQSHYFTVQIYSARNPDYPYPTGLHDRNGKPFSFSSGKGTWVDFIPIRSMGFNYTSYENMAIPLHILGDFPLLHRKRVTSINFSCYDIDDDRIEKALKAWESQCFPGSCVEYLDNIKAVLTYNSYDVKGRKNFSAQLEVIPAGSVSVSRSYEENAAKILNFSVVAVGFPGASASMGGSNGKGGFKIGELGYGTGSGYVDLVYERHVQGAINSYDEKNKIQVQ